MMQMLNFVISMKRQVTIKFVVPRIAFINTKVIGLTSLHVSNGAELEP